MKKNYTHISIILDRTGSMESIRDDVIGGFNTFLKEQKEQKGKCTCTLVQFDTQEPYEVIHDFKLIKEVKELTKKTYVPRASTPLLDALGRGINDLEKKISEMKKKDQPEKVVFVIVTDGQENSSREFRKEQIEKMIKEKQEKDKWQLVFLSADLDSIQDAYSYGFATLNTMSYDKNSKGTRNAFRSLSSNIKSYRASVVDTLSFTEDDRKKQESEVKKENKE